MVDWIINLSPFAQWLAFITPQFFALIGSLFAGFMVLLWWARK